MGLAGRYFSQRDINLVNQFNAELMRDIIETYVVCFKICATETRVNMYGEASTGRNFADPVLLFSLI